MDNDIRSLERLAKRGDKAAQAKLAKSRLRSGNANRADIEAFFNALCDNEYSWRENEIVIKRLETPTGVEVRVSREYENPIEVNFGLLKQISEFFQTDKIDVDNWAYRGCESCDYDGSSASSFQIFEPGIAIDYDSIMNHEV